MTTCLECKKDCPDEFIAPMFVNGTYTYVDPECALAITNKVHGFNRTSFKGKMAQQMLEDFREWKETK
jgi:hypothetical protein